MKLATFEESGSARAGLVVDGGVIDLAKADPALPRDMIALIREWPALESRVRALDGAKPHFQLAEVRLKAPVPHPQKILAIGLNYADHIEESGVPKPDRQIWFSKLPSAVNGPYDPIQIPKASTSVDYEAEFVAIVGKRCRHVSKEDAAGVIFGYCAGNDVSVRDWQFHTSQWILGKSFDTHAPFGPWIVTPDESRRSARAWHPLPRQRRAASELEHPQSGLQRVRPDRAAQRSDDAGTRRRDLHRDARWSRVRDEATHLSESRRCRACRNRPDRCFGSRYGGRSLKRSVFSEQVFIRANVAQCHGAPTISTRLVYTARQPRSL